MTRSTEQDGALATAASGPPGAVLVSFWILLVSAAVRVLFAILTLVRWSTITQAELRQPLPPHTTIATATQEIHTQLTASVILGLVFAALYVLFAFLVRAGRNLARATLTVVIVVFGIYDIFRGTDIVTLSTVLIELVAVALLYLPNSRDYFKPTDVPA